MEVFSEGHILLEVIVERTIEAVHGGAEKAEDGGEIQDEGYGTPWVGRFLDHGFGEGRIAVDDLDLNLIKFLRLSQHRLARPSPDVDM